MTEVHDEIAEHASTRITQWVVISSTAAEAMAQVAAVLARQRAARDEEARAAARREVEAAQAEARLQWEPMLDPKRRADSTLSEAGVAWASAQAWRDRDPLAEEVANHAEDRLRDLRPDAMRYYDEAREQGVDPVTAMRMAAPYFDDVVHHEGQAVPEREQLERSGMALEAGIDRGATTAPPSSTPGPQEPVDESDLLAQDPRTTPAAGTSSAIATAGAQYDKAAAAADVREDVQRSTERQLVARVDDPSTPGLDEHVEGLDLAVEPRGEARTARRSAEDLRQASVQAKEAAASDPSAQNLAAVTYPQPLHTTSAKTATGSQNGTGMSLTQRAVVDQAQKAIQKPNGGRTR